MFIVVWVENNTKPYDESACDDDLTDIWEARHNFEDADKLYKELLKRENVYTASLCTTLRSTDYI